ncbi:hypothetical protein ACRE_029360 [Hapsidospora chrysogenum ATCC 11550]|uniref:Stress-associated endoplasmic reticulum protein n=1 Tax=Hapsidospora chrysogenum (strain ATCC 11550 / CBS 779.69 / DSM 880 / IAM 14645 / JCM 23072 / IMI 49137) TaxID=857340 RepID=A0A086TA74_HAPC1|nr:hypothetical protein ACRE_029360 [Hapsidospora chrysogenum ATCC 11550]
MYHTRRRNAKFARTQEARMGKSEEQLKKKTKVVQKAPISTTWIGKYWNKPTLTFLIAIFGFIIVGGLIFEAISRFLL